MRATRLLVYILASFWAVFACAQALPDAPSALLMAGNDSASGLRTASDDLAPVSAMIEPAMVQSLPKPANESRKVMDKKFLILNGLVLATTAADMEFTQHCQDAGTCVEMNPTIPRARWAKHLVNVPTNAAVIYWSYRWKKEGKKLWWVPPLVDVAIHSVGLWSNTRFAF